MSKSLKVWLLVQVSKGGRSNSIYHPNDRHGDYYTGLYGIRGGGNNCIGEYIMLGESLRLMKNCLAMISWENIRLNH